MTMLYNLLPVICLVLSLRAPSLQRRPLRGQPPPALAREFALTQAAFYYCLICCARCDVVAVGFAFVVVCSCSSDSSYGHCSAFVCQP